MRWKVILSNSKIVELLKNILKGFVGDKKVPTKSGNPYHADGDGRFISGKEGGGKKKKLTAKEKREAEQKAKKEKFQKAEQERKEAKKEAEEIAQAEAEKKKVEQELQRKVREVDIVGMELKGGGKIKEVSRHAKERIKEREATYEQMKSLFTEPDEIKQHDDPEKVIYCKNEMRGIVAKKEKKVVTVFTIFENGMF